MNLLWAALQKSKYLGPFIVDLGGYALTTVGLELRQLTHISLLRSHLMNSGGLSNTLGTYRLS